MVSTATRKEIPTALYAITHLQTDVCRRHTSPAIWGAIEFERKDISPWRAPRKGKSCESCTEKKTVAGGKARPKAEARSAVREAMAFFNDEADIDRLLVAAEKLIA